MKNIPTRVLTLMIVALVFFSTQLLGQANPAQQATAPTPVKKNPLDKGDFKVGFSPITRAKTPKKAMPADEKAAFQEIATSLNTLIALPKDIYLNIDTCGEANAFYSPDSEEIIFCYELIDQFDREFNTISKDQARVDEMVEDTIVQTLFHELGHCLIDVWDLPATGREEDAVDQLASILMLDGSAEGQLSTIHAALEFDIASRGTEKDDMVFWDEHSFSKTRFYDMICLAYGSNPTKNGNMVGPDKLPVERAQRCETEFKRAQHAWFKLLTPYFL
jgi:hypothetical protein